jgi:DNA-formamidopyrimidine glycosylase
MPEIAEVATFAKQLSTEYGGHDLLDIEFVGGRFLKSEYDSERIELLGLEFPLHHTAFFSKGKFIYWSMSNPSNDINHLFFTLGMSGSFGKKQKHSAIKFTFDNGEIFFNDPRHFGTFRIVDTDLELRTKLGSLGWDPLKESIPTDLVLKIRKYNHKKIGEFLMEQGPLICGIGNYLRAEILYLSRISPFRLIGDLSDDELSFLFEKTVSVVKEAFAQQGATLSTYSDLYGIAGDFYKQFKVYNRKTDPEGHPVLKEKDKNGRTIHYVPAVQL